DQWRGFFLVRVDSMYLLDIKVGDASASTRDALRCLLGRELQYFPYVLRMSVRDQLLKRLTNDWTLFLTVQVEIQYRERHSAPLHSERILLVFGGHVHLKLPSVHDQFQQRYYSSDNYNRLHYVDNESRHHELV